MTAFNRNQVSRNAPVAASPAAQRAMRRGAGRVGRRVAALYGWLSGPPVTELERSRAALAEARNSQGRRGLFI